jgi:SH3-like domain-containing protein
LRFLPLPLTPPLKGEGNTRALSAPVVLLALFLIIFFPLLAVAQDDAEDKNVSGLPLPRFASLRSNEINLRTGPGTRYPIDWVFKHQGMPVEVTAEYDIWRRVRDSEGTEGWVHKMALSGKRAALVTGATHDLHKRDDVESAVVAHLEAGAVGQLLSCSKAWCKLKFEGIKGYLPKTDFWGAYPNETFD